MKPTARTHAEDFPLTRRLQATVIHGRVWWWATGIAIGLSRARRRLLRFATTSAAQRR